jgi:hypothetical protein
MTHFIGILRASAFASFALVSQTALAAEAMDVYKSATCGCCTAWTAIMRDAGFEVTERNMSQADLDAVKVAAGLKPGQTSCHTGKINGFVIEGHVPVREVQRLLDERPDAIGLTVPDMPYGSPGMGEAGDNADPYDVLLVRRDGTTEVYQSYR